MARKRGETHTPAPTPAPFPPLPTSDEIAAQAAAAIRSCEKAAEQLRSLGNTMESTGHTLALQANALAEDYLRRARAFAANVAGFGELAHLQADQVRTLREQLDALEGRGVTMPTNGAGAPDADPDFKEVAAQ